MKHTSMVATVVLATAFMGCQQSPEGPSGGAGTCDEALASAHARGTMLMLDFYSPN